MAAERNELLRSAFIAKIGNGYVPEQFVFLDESAKDERTLSRRYGYSYASTRARSKVPALTNNGIVAIEVMEGSYNKKKFEDFIYTQVVCGSCFTLRPVNLISYIYINILILHVADTSYESVSWQK